MRSSDSKRDAFDIPNYKMRKRKRIRNDDLSCKSSFKSDRCWRYFELNEYGRICRSFTADFRTYTPKKKINEIIDRYNQEAVKKWPKKLPDEIVLLSICEQYWRSRDELMNTPSYLIDVIIEKNNTDFRLSKT